MCTAVVNVRAALGACRTSPHPQSNEIRDNPSPPNRARPRMSHFVTVDRDTAYLLPPSVDEWLPQNHLAHFVLEVIEQLDLSDLTRQYTGRGSAAHHPEPPQAGPQDKDQVNLTDAVPRLRRRAGLNRGSRIGNRRESQKVDRCTGTACKYERHGTSGTSRIGARRASAFA